MACTITEVTCGSVKGIKFAWTIASSSSGAATGTTTKYYNGLVQQLCTVPDGSAAPSASYDITILDGSSVDVLMNAGANRHTANTEQVKAASLGTVVESKLTLNVANAGSSTAGTVYLRVR